MNQKRDLHQNELPFYVISNFKLKNPKLYEVLLFERRMKKIDEQRWQYFHREKDIFQWKGKVTFENEDEYDGEWKGKHPNGKGIFRIKSQTYSSYTQKGTFVDGEL